MRPRTIRIVVDLPAPLGPRKPWTSPGATSRSSPSSARTEPKFLVNACVRTMDRDELIGAELLPQPRNGPLGGRPLPRRSLGLLLRFRDLAREDGRERFAGARRREDR